MKKIISFVGLFAVLGVGIGDAHGVAMSAQVRRLLQEKQEKIEQLEKCEGKKQGWMIAGISTIGLTAVGVGVNIAQASKSNRLSSEIEMEKSTLERHQDELNRIQNDIAAERARQSEANKCCDMKRRCCECEKLRDGDCPGGDDEEGNLTTYSDYVLSCKMTMFTFRTGQVRDDLVDALNKACYEVTKQYMERTETNGFVKYECKDYREKANCDKQQNDKECPDITYSYAWPLEESYLSKIRAKLAEYESRCVAQGGSFDYVRATTPAGDVAIGGGKAVCRNRTKCDANEVTNVQVDAGIDVNPVSPEKTETSLQKCLRERSGDRVGTACCYLSKSVATYEKGQCVCAGGKEFSIGKDGHGKCSAPTTDPEYDETDAENCRLSGGGWEYRKQYKRWECFCGINQSASDKNMVQTSGFKTCACKKDYIWIDDNDHSKGCKRGISAAENASNRTAEITGYCLNQEGDAGNLDQSKKTFCWCDIYMQDYCAKSKLFSDQNGVCTAGSKSDTACTDFCKSKRTELVKWCDELNGK